MADIPSTVIVNNTKKDLDMKVGNQNYFADFTSVRSGAKHTMRIACNDTYREFLLGIDAKGKKLIVTSDDCCDFTCITVTEVDGRFSVHKVPRRQPTPTAAPADASRRRPAEALKLRKAPVKKLNLLFNWGFMCR